MNDATERIRIHLAVTPRVKDRLDDLLRKTEAESITEVVRRALSIYDDLVNTALAGGKILLEDKKGDQREVQITW
ncbi:MAG: hypothetical protein U1E73_09870 [Planctomycetota bacterium]